MQRRSRGGANCWNVVFDVAFPDDGGCPVRMGNSDWPRLLGGCGRPQWGKLDSKAVATAVDWPVRFVPKAAEAELKGRAKVNLKADSCSYEIEACECE